MCVHQLYVRLAHMKLTKHLPMSRRLLLINSIVKSQESTFFLQPLITNDSLIMNRERTADITNVSVSLYYNLFRYLDP